MLPLCPRLIRRRDAKWHFMSSQQSDLDLIEPFVKFLANKPCPDSDKQACKVHNNLLCSHITLSRFLIQDCLSKGKGPALAISLFEPHVLSCQTIVGGGGQEGGQARAQPRPGIAAATWSGRDPSWCRVLVPRPVLVPPWGNHGLEEAGQPVLTSDGRLLLLGFLLYFHLLGS